MRFANALVRHPVLCQEQLVVMFLTVPTVRPRKLHTAGTAYIVSRNLQYGASKLQYQYRKSSQADLCHQVWRMPCRQIYRRHLILSVPASDSLPRDTLDYAACLSA